MHNKVDRLLILLSFIVFTSTGCSQVIKTEYSKGKLLNEVPTGKSSVFERTPLLELQNPLAVKIFESVQTHEEYQQKYEKVQLDTIADKNPEHVFKMEFFRPFLMALIVPMFYSDFWLSGYLNCRDDYNRISSGSHNAQCSVRPQLDTSVVANEHIMDVEYKNVIARKEQIKSGFVSVRVNDKAMPDLAINVDGSAKFQLEKYFDLLEKDQEIKVKFTYKTTSQSSIISYADAEKTALALLPAYRKNGADNKSAYDYITAFKISNDPLDLAEAIKFANTENAKDEINSLLAKYNDALDLLRFKQSCNSGLLTEFVVNYPNSKHISEAHKIIEKDFFEETKKNNDPSKYITKYPSGQYVEEANKIIKRGEYKNIIDKNCNGEIMNLFTFLRDSNMYADKGKCVSIIATKMQITSANTGLFKVLGDTLVYIEFPTAFRGYVVQGVAKIKGEYSYVTQLSTFNSVPHFQFISYLPE